MRSSEPRRRGRFVTTSVTLEPDMVAKLDDLAYPRGLSRSDFVRELLILGLDRYEHQQRVLAAVS